MHTYDLVMKMLLINSCKASNSIYWFNSLYIFCCSFKTFLHSNLIQLVCCQYIIFFQITSIYFSIIYILHPVLMKMRWLHQVKNFHQNYVCVLLWRIEIFNNYSSIFPESLQTIYHYSLFHLTVMAGILFP